MNNAGDFETAGARVRTMSTLRDGAVQVALRCVSAPACDATGETVCL